MDHFKQYLAQEVALDHAGGQLSRREALRRLGMMGGRVNATRDAARAALDKTTVPHEVKTYPGVGHAFYSQVDSEQSKAAYSDVVTWFGKYLT